MTLATFWEQVAAKALAAPTEAYTWACARPECDGLPHEGALYAHARTKQRLPDGDWALWVLLCGRGWGKGRTASETFLDMVQAHPVDVQGLATEWLVAGATYDDTVKLCWEGVSGLKHALRRRGYADRTVDPSSPKWYTYQQMQKLVTLSTGQRIVLAYAEGNDDLGRGGSWAGMWLDELGTYKNRIRAAWDESLLFSLRAKLPGGWRPRIMITTTPKTSAKEAHDLLSELVNTPSPTTIVTRGPTWENAHNLPPSQLQLWDRMFPPGTRSRRQELEAELLSDIEGALWTAELVDRARVPAIPSDVQVVRRVVSIDPATTSGPDSDETGIHLVAKGMHDVADPETGRTNREPHFYVEHDATMRAPATEWARVAVQLAVDHSADLLYESDQGGDAWRTILQQAARALGVPCPRILAVRAATEGSKPTRAQPVVALYHEGRVHHVGYHAELETQMTTWVPEHTRKSPDRVDSVVYGVRELSKLGAAPAPARRLW